MQADDSFHLAVEEGHQDIGGYADSELRNIVVKKYITLDPVGSTVRYEMMKLCTWSVEDTMRR